LKTLLLLAGFCAVLAGLLFAGQGTGYVPWPHSSFMIGKMTWAYYGTGIIVAGIAMIAFSQRMRRAHG
jgi:hypothetical protein